MANSPNCCDSPQNESYQRQLECINQINFKLLLHWRGLCKENFKELQNLEQQLKITGNKLAEKQQALPILRAKKQACSDRYETFITKLKDSYDKLDDLTKEANQCKIKTTTNNDLLYDMLMKLKTDENDIRVRIEELTNRNDENDWDRKDTPCSHIEENGKGENTSVTINSPVFVKETKTMSITTPTWIGQGDDCIKESTRRKENNLNCRTGFQHTESTSIERSEASSETNILKVGDNEEPILCERSNDIIVHYTSQDIKEARELRDSTCCTPGLVIVDTDYSTTDTSEDTTPNHSIIPENYRNSSEFGLICDNSKESGNSSEQYLSSGDLFTSKKEGKLVSESRRQFPPLCSDFEQSTTYHDHLVTKTVLSISELKSIHMLPLTCSPGNGEGRDVISSKTWDRPTEVAKPTKSHTIQIREKERKIYDKSKLDACILSTTDLKTSRNIEKRKAGNCTTINQRKRTGILPPIERTQNNKSVTLKIPSHLALRMTNNQNKHGTDKHVCFEDLKNVDSENSVPSKISYNSSDEPLVDVNENITNDVYEIARNHENRLNNTIQYCNNYDPFCFESVDTKANECRKTENETLSSDSDEVTMVKNEIIN